jgi:superfamily II helicase
MENNKLKIANKIYEEIQQLTLAKEIMDEDNSYISVFSKKHNSVRLPESVASRISDAVFRVVLEEREQLRKQFEKL